MRILLTGASGFIGRHLREAWEGLHDLQAPSHADLDLLDPEAVEEALRAFQPDVVVHAATWDATASSLKDPEQVLDANLRMYLALDRSRRHFGRLIYFGSGAEFDRAHWRPGMAEPEFGMHLPTDAYGFSKYVMERMHRPGEPVLNLRLFGVFGPHEDWRVRFISNICCRALHGLPLALRQNRRFDYTWIGDVVDLTSRFLQGPLEAGTLNLCAGAPVALLDIAERVRILAGEDLPIQVAAPGMGPEYSGSNARLQHVLGPVAFTPLEEGIQALWEWYRPRISHIDPALL